MICHDNRVGLIRHLMVRLCVLTPHAWQKSHVVAYVHLFGGRCSGNGKGTGSMVVTHISSSDICMDIHYSVLKEKSGINQPISLLIEQQ